MKFDFYLSENQSEINNITLTVEDHTLSTPFTFNTPLKIAQEDWDQEKQRPKNIYLKKNKKINARLDEIKIQLASLFTGKITRNKGISHRTVSRLIKKIAYENKTIYDGNSFIYFMDLYISSKKEIICNSTYKRYKVFKHLIERFEGYLLKRLYIDDINHSFINSFITFGLNESYSKNTLLRTLHFIRTILNFIERKGIKTAVNELDIPKEKCNKQIITLSEEEILKIKHTPVPPELQDAKDWLLISCYTGQRYSDFIRFNKSQLIQIQNINCISFTQQKTNKKVVLPLHPIVLNIIRQYPDNFPNPMNIQKYNKQLKEIAHFSGINQKIIARKRMNHRVYSIAVQKWEALSSHVGRRSFATNFYGKIPTPLLMEATGHGTEQVFLKYINSIDHSKIVLLNNHFLQVYQNRESKYSRKSRKERRIMSGGMNSKRAKLLT